MPILGESIQGGFRGREWHEFERMIETVRKGDFFFDGSFSSAFTTLTYRQLCIKFRSAYQQLWENDGRNTVIPYTELPEDFRFTSEELSLLKNRANEIIATQNEVDDRKHYSGWILKAVEEVQKYSPDNVAQYRRGMLRSARLT